MISRIMAAYPDTTISLRSFTSWPSDTDPPSHMPRTLEAATFSRITAPATAILAPGVCGPASLASRACTA